MTETWDASHTDVKGHVPLPQIFISGENNGMDQSDEIRHRIQERIDAIGIKIQAASLKAGLGQTTLRDFMVGRAKTITLRSLTKLAPVLLCSPEWLATGRDPENGPNEDPESAELHNIFASMPKRKRAIVLDLARELSNQKKA